MAPEANLPRSDVDVPGDYFSLVGFEVTIYGRFSGDHGGCGYCFTCFQSRLIRQEEALHNASNPDEFKMRIASIYSQDHTLSDITTPAASPAPYRHCRPCAKKRRQYFREALVHALVIGLLHIGH